MPGMPSPSLVHVSAFFFLYVQNFTKHVNLPAGLVFIGLYAEDVTACSSGRYMKELFVKDY